MNIQAVKKEKSHKIIYISIAVAGILIILLGIYISIKSAKKEEVKPPVKQEEVIPKEEVKVPIKEEKIGLNSEEIKEISEFTYGCAIKSAYANVSEISDKDKINITMTKLGFKDQYSDIYGQMARGVSEEDLTKKMKEIFGEDITANMVDTERYMYNAITKTYTSLKSTYEGYKKINVPISCIKKENIYEFTVATAEGCLDAEKGTFSIIDTNNEELVLNLLPSEIESDYIISNKLLKDIDRLPKYKFILKRNVENKLQFNAFEVL